jgi:hypothetical protein
MNYKSNALLVVLLAVGLAYLALYLDVLPAALQVCLGALVVLFLPGYLLSEVFFPYLRGVQRLTLSLGFSSVFVLLLGFGLHLSGFGLVQEMWLAGAFYSTLILGILALFRVARQGDREGLGPLQVPRLHEPLLVVVALGIAVAAVAVASDTSRRQDTPITQLWILPKTSSTAELGFVSSEITTFRLEVTGDGEELISELVVTADAQAKVIPLELSKTYDRLEATLYLPSSTTPYRRVLLW